MVYAITGNSIVTNGQTGRYDGKVNNPNVRYARNAVDNHNKAVIDLTQNPKNITGYQMQYAPDSAKGNIPAYAQAALAAAYEELGHRQAVSVEELDARLQAQIGVSTVSAKALDLNEDGMIDIAEYGSAIALKDYNSDGLVDGKSNDKGELAILKFFNPKNAATAKKTFGNFYNGMKMGEAQEAFLADPNNTTKVEE